MPDAVVRDGLTFEEATRPDLLAMFGGEVTARDEGMVVLRFPNVHAAASWAETAELSKCSYLSSNRIGSGPSLDDWCFIEVMNGI